MKKQVFFSILILYCMLSPVFAENPETIIEKYMNMECVDTDIIEKSMMEAGKPLAAFQDFADGKIDSIRFVNISNCDLETKKQFSADFSAFTESDHYIISKTIQQDDGAARIIIWKKDGIIYKVFVFMNDNLVSVGAVVLFGEMKNYSPYLLN